MVRIRLFVLFFFATALIQVNANKEWQENKIFKYDASGYYLYLPAIFLH